jgi:hypothetical protein
VKYGRKECAKSDGNKWQHVSVCSDSGSRPRDPSVNHYLPSIRVNPRGNGDTLDPMSRINLGKIYTVEHNVKVDDYGDVDPEDLESLKKHWEYYYHHLR